MYLIEKIKSGWTLLKFIRVIFSGLILYSSIQTGLAGGMILGTTFLLFSLFTDGVCAGACYTSIDKTTKEEFEYEELGVK